MRNKILFIGCLLLFLYGCEQNSGGTVDDKNNKIENGTENIDVGSAGNDAEQYKDADFMTDFHVDELIPHLSGYTEVRGYNIFGDFIGLLDEDLKWVIEPNNTILGLKDISDGLIAAAVSDTRETRINDTDESNKLWGYLDEKGDWAIKPQFRDVGYFSEGLSFVWTVEEDRDDLGNFRGTVINKKGKEIGELVPKTYYDKYRTYNNGDVLLNTKYINNTISFGLLGDNESVNYTVLDNKGNKLDIPDVNTLKQNETDFILTKPLFTGYDMVWVVKKDEKTDIIYNYNLKNKELNTNTINRNMPGMGNNGSYYETNYTNELTNINFSRENKTIFYSNFLDSSRVSALYDFNGNPLLDKPITSEYGYIITTSKDNWLSYSAENRKDLEYVNLKTGERERLTLNENSSPAYYKNFYWELGEEYAVLKTFNGKEILGEENKIVMTEYMSNYKNKNFYEMSSVVEVEYRVQGDQNVYATGLVNYDTGKFHKLDELEGWNFTME